jgi:hypothetical protein
MCNISTENEELGTLWGSTLRDHGINLCNMQETTGAFFNRIGEVTVGMEEYKFELVKGYASDCLTI